MGSVYLTTPTAAVFDYEDATCTLIVTVTDNGVTGSKGTLMLKRREQDGAVPTTLCTLCAARAVCVVCAVCSVPCAVCRMCPNTSGVHILSFPPSLLLAAGCGGHCGAKSTTGVIEIEITDVNEPPSLSTTAANVDENLDIGTLVKTLTAKDPEDDAITYVLIGCLLVLMGC